MSSEALDEVRNLPLDRLAGEALDFGGELIYARPLSLDQTLAIIRLAHKATFGMPAEKRAELQGAMQAAGDDDAASQQSGVMLLLSLLEKDVILDVLSVLTERPRAWVESHFTLVGVVRLITAQLKVNSVAEIAGLFRQMAELWRSSASASSQG